MMLRVGLFAGAFASLYAQCPDRAQLSLVEGSVAPSKADAAAELLVRLQGSYPDCHEILLLLGRVRAAQGRPDLGRGLLIRYTQLEPRDLRGFMTLAEFLTRQGEYSQAAAALRTALEIDPDSVAALLAAGVILARQGREHDAEVERDLKRACRLEPGNPKAHFQSGVFLDNRGRYAEAVAAFQKVVSLDTNNPTAWRYLGMEYELEGEPAKAEAAFRHGMAVNRSPRFDPLLPYHYGRLLLLLGRLAESKVQLDRAVELLPEYGAVFYQRAKLNLEMAKYADARNDAEHVLAIPEPRRFTDDSQIYYLLTSIYQRLGEREQAQKSAAKARAAQLELEQSRKASNLARIASNPAASERLR